MSFEPIEITDDEGAKIHLNKSRSRKDAVVVTIVDKDRFCKANATLDIQQTCDLINALCRALIERGKDDG